MFPRMRRPVVHVWMSDLAGLVQREIQAVGAVRGVGGEDGMGHCGVVGWEAVWRVWFCGVGLVLVVGGSG